MLDHLGLDVTDYERSKAFYERALAPLRIGLVMEPVHVAFAASSRDQVDAFHAAALAAGASDNGGPGVREIYHPDYGAFVLDPDGNNVEAVCHTPADTRSHASRAVITR
jgi:catechol 2,3-dioxygenase-like lactoylglutathione lyase family enzyme